METGGTTSATCLELLNTKIPIGTYPTMGIVGQDVNNDENHAVKNEVLAQHAKYGVRFRG